MKKMNVILTTAAMVGMFALTGCGVTVSTGELSIPVKEVVTETPAKEAYAGGSAAPEESIVAEGSAVPEENVVAEEIVTSEEGAVAEPEYTDWTQVLDQNKEWMFRFFEDEELAYSFELTTDESDYLTYGTLVCQGNNGTYWEYQTGKHELGQNYTVEFICESPDCFYVNDGGTVVALDIRDGHIVWENDEYQGGGTISVFDDDGNLYISGYEYPALMIVDPNGNTLLYVEQFADYYWTSDMSIEDSILTIYFEGREGAGVQMDIRDYSYTIL